MITVELTNVFNFFQNIWTGAVIPFIVLLGLGLGGFLVRWSRKLILPDPYGPGGPPPTSDPPLENPPPNPGFDPN